MRSNRSARVRKGGVPPGGGCGGGDLGKGGKRGRAGEEDRGVTREVGVWVEAPSKSPNVVWGHPDPTG